ncbi:MAG: BON domain-containing protein [Planctomycetaceae bacterium]
MRSLSFTEPSRTICDLVQRCVQTRTSGRIRELRVDLENGSVVLSGRTSTYYSKQLATQAAFDAVENVPVTNEIEVC